MRTFLRRWRKCLGGLLYRRLLREHVQADIDGHFLVRYHVFGGGKDRLDIAQSAAVLNAFFNVSSGCIRIGENVMFGNNVSVLTGRHDPDKFGSQRQHWPAEGGDVEIQDGAWIASHAVVLGPCVIGEHAVVAAGAVVTRDVPPRTMVGGVPAKVIRKVGKPDG